ncbi:Glutamine--fructose-6-phosphate aminotransferase[isomerizing] [Candidatus Erwinia haradaeae]|uniref:Glutamine--fructose-6-phosphate aminotransferase [isomerizing] n=1 Tax=Candidatus Erwinia haradaeae TaxID=1922217 RepID=A0A451D001_9GAMM|nr:glutamine--fructose-6-phosphate transaminase (isomerizing) [Candidatus Erwinia haradaeae]VFP78614.1 Glutamine--fructose-6-phosphate aminotransferase[isomerizing] [Candidatus Erwinia haradaeae]
MCGIIGAISYRNIVEILLDGLRRLEYRGYDSSGLAIVDIYGQVIRLRRLGGVQNLADAVENTILSGKIGIAHTRWATHGKPSEINAHPHISSDISIVHNGIIENYQSIYKQLRACGYICSSETDTEVVAHLVDWEGKKGGSFLEVVQRVLPRLRGTYGMVILDRRMPDRLIAARSGSPLVIGCSVGENFIGSDPIALLPVTRRLIYLEEGDIAQITSSSIMIFDRCGNSVQRPEILSNIRHDSVNKGVYHHYMQKEIYEQSTVIKKRLKGCLKNNKVDLSELGSKNEILLKNLKHIQIVACGTSYNAGMVARYWFESLIQVPCDVEIASEFRYRQPVVRHNSFLITLSQSGETADTLAALRLSKTMSYLGSLAICNVPGSSLVRESDLVLMTQAGPEIGVASTKSFTSQLTILLMLLAKISYLKGMKPEIERNIVEALKMLPYRIDQMLLQNDFMADLAKDFINKENALFLGRGTQYPIAMEGALKLKEISYIHAEAYAAGELKHGPLALIDDNMPVIVVAPDNDLLEKIKSNIEEVRARGGSLYIFTNAQFCVFNIERMHIISLPYVETIITPISYTVPLQLLSYHIALLKGNNVDQPRNLAKSVTVE